MDKYQEFILKNSTIRCFLLVRDEVVYRNIFSDQQIVLEQDEDITIKEYALRFTCQCVESISAQQNGKNISFSKRDTIFELPIDFEDKIDSIKITFQNCLADDLIIPVVYKEADKEAYYARQAELHKAQLLSKAAIKCATGADLVNIYFQPCSDECVRTEIILYRDKQMLAKYKVEEEFFFKSITGLAYGTYSFVLKQYDKDSKIILESNPISFTIQSWIEVKEKGSMAAPSVI